MHNYKSKLANALFLFILSTSIGIAQSNLSPEMLWNLKRVSAIGITKDNKNVIFTTTQHNFEDNSKKKQIYSIPLKGGDAVAIEGYEDLIANKNISPDGRYTIQTKDIKLKPVYGKDFHKKLTKSNVHIYDELNYRHWDEWEDGAYSHVMLENRVKKAPLIDLMKGEPFDCPQKPFGGDEDYIWGPEGKTVVYVTKKTNGVDYATSTNSDLYEYNLATKKTTNLTRNNKGYDTQPAYSKSGTLAWCQMKRNGYESDKNDIMVRLKGANINITAGWDGTVNGFVWAESGTKIYFNAPVNGTVQLFEIELPTLTNLNGNKPPAFGTLKPRQITDGQFDVSGLIGQVKNTFVVSRRDMNHASELYTVNLKNGKLTQLSHANDELYAKINLCEVKKRMVTTTDKKQMLTWVIYPPNFDPNKKYPTLLYCQGGPQGALSQFYSFRWNFQLMASQGYIVVAPNRRGMPGYGVEWNEQISKDYGGQNMQDYLAAIDDVSKEAYVDKNRLGCVGASYGGYSCFFLEGIHNGRFKTFIAHDGIFNWRSMYGTTEEIFFPNWDLGGPYWDNTNKEVLKSYSKFNPITYVKNWKTPIMIIQGGKDYRVPIGQGLEAFQAAQLMGLKSRLLYFPEENHWVLNPQNAIIWQREFFKWLKETL